MYVLLDDGHAITEPMTIEEIIEQFGSIKDLEASGIRIIKVD